ncbi:MAG: hypothetical protein KDA75_16305 [Planctomycetaceae bacterium]|nr:hypothetical protein [Planctomycetaceae bacterium]
MAPSSLSPAAQLRRCSELEYLLLGDLREMLEEEITPQSRRWMLAVLDALLDTLPREHRLQSADGYLTEVLREIPNWATRVNRLESRYYELFDRLSDLRDELEVDLPDKQSVSTLRYDLHEWMGQLVAHRARESDLLVTAINIDIGGSG